MWKVLFILVISANGFAGWQDHWAKAVEFCENKNFVEAELEFTAAINSNDNAGRAHLYLDRSRTNLFMGKFQEALSDVNKALEMGTLEGNDILRARVTHYTTILNLGIEGEERAKSKEEFLKAATIPTIEISKETITIRNNPDCECYRRNVTKMLVLSEIYCFQLNLKKILEKSF